MKTKIYTRLISIIMTMSVVISSICCFPYKSFSATLYNVSTSYSGNYDSESPMQFDVYSLNRNTSTFTGHITIDATSLSINIDKDVSGTVTFYQNYYVCNFSFKYKWLVISFDTTFSITVYPREGKVDAQETAIGYLPYAKDINLEGLDMTEADLEKILDVDKDAWKEELKGVDELYAKFGDKLPKELSDVLNEVKSNLDK